jgi:hypothetical protein
MVSQTIVESCWFWVRMHSWVAAGLGPLVLLLGLHVVAPCVD